MRINWLESFTMNTLNVISHAFHFAFLIKAYICRNEDSTWTNHQARKAARRTKETMVAGLGQLGLYPTLPFHLVGQLAFSPRPFATAMTTTIMLS